MVLGNQIKDDFMLTNQNSDARDKKLFQELDKHSTALRTSAEKFAIFLMKIKNQSPEIKSLMKSLDHIVVSSIEKMDESITGFNKNMLSLNTKTSNPATYNTVITNEHLVEYIKLSQEVAMNAANLSEKAAQLDQQN